MVQKKEAPPFPLKEIFFLNGNLEYPPCNQGMVLIKVFFRFKKVIWLFGGPKN